MTEQHTNFSGTYDQLDLSGSRARRVLLRGARVNDVDLRDVVVRGAWVQDTVIDGEIDSLVVNGVDVAPYVRAELEKRHPELARLDPTEPAGYVEIWDLIERQWAGTVERAQGLPEEKLHERVEGEWSFIETLRHLVFATDSWILRAYLGEPRPWHPLGLPHEEMPDNPPVPRDRGARPSLEEILAVRAERQAVVRQVYAELTPERLEEVTTPVEAPGYPEPEAYAVPRVLRCILHEEWWHRQFAERDLGVLGAG